MLPAQVAHGERTGITEQGITAFLPVLVTPQHRTLPAVIPFKIVVSEA